ncbi:hypothetical protein B0H19DRAFT_1160802 [Mycena capillaripes]|nr:hypothetical protein B0H19DRAFT_1160802 [Mycena capillaripes]
MDEIVSLSIYVSTHTRSHTSIHCMPHCGSTPLPSHLHLLLLIVQSSFFCTCIHFMTLTTFTIITYQRILLIPHLISSHLPLILMYVCTM